MRSKSLLIFMLFMITGLIALGPVLAQEPNPIPEAPGAGNGSAENPYQIATLANLYWIAEVSSRWDKHYIQTDNIDAHATKNWDGDAGWTPIGNDSTRFTGSYDGQGHYIERLKIDRPDTNNVGLFGHVGHDSAATTIKNLGLKNVSVKGARGTGSLIGRVTGNINTVVENCYALGGEVVGDGATGGLVGSFNSYHDTPAQAENFRPRMIQCYTDIAVSFSGKETAENDKFGGLAGCAQKGRIVNSYARGSVTAGGCERVGGLAGCIYYRGIIKNSYSTGTVSGDDASNIGGLIGFKGTGNLEGSEEGVSFWDTETSGQEESAAGAGKTTSEMKTQSTFTDAGWNFETLWAIDGAINDGYPYLQETLTDVAAKLAIAVQPEGGFSGKELTTQPVIEIHDEAGVIVSSDSSTTVTVTLYSGADGSLDGDKTVTAAQGVVTFTDLALTGLAGEAYVLQFTADDLDAVDSEEVKIKVRGWGSLHVSGKMQLTIQPISYESRSNTLTVRITVVPDPELDPIPEGTTISVYVYNLEETAILTGQVEDEPAQELTMLKIPLSSGPLRTRHAITATVVPPDS